MHAVTSLTPVWNASDPEDARRRLHATVAEGEIRHVQNVAERAVGGSAPAVRQYLQLWRDFTDAGLRAACSDGDSGDVLLEHLDSEDAASRRELRRVLDTGAADAPFSPWTASFGLGDGVILSALAEVGRALTGCTNEFPRIEDAADAAGPADPSHTDQTIWHSESFSEGDHSIEIRLTEREPRLRESLFTYCCIPARAESPRAAGREGYSESIIVIPGRASFHVGKSPDGRLGVHFLPAEWQVEASPETRRPARSRSHRFLALLHQLLANEETHQLDRVADLFDLHDGELGKLFGVTRQAIGNWRASAVPASRQAKLVTILKTADVLAHNLKTDRIPGIARKPAEAYGGISMLDLIARDRHDDLLRMVEESFDWSAGE